MLLICLVRNQRRFSLQKTFFEKKMRKKMCEKKCAKNIFFVSKICISVNEKKSICQTNRRFNTPVSFKTEKIKITSHSKCVRCSSSVSVDNDMNVCVRFLWWSSACCVCNLTYEKRMAYTTSQNTCCRLHATHISYWIYLLNKTPMFNGVPIISIQMMHKVSQHFIWNQNATEYPLKHFDWFALCA